MEQNGNVWNTLEATVSYSTWAWLTPTLTHVVAYKLATSGAEDGAMSKGVMLLEVGFERVDGDFVFLLTPFILF